MLKPYKERTMTYQINYSFTQRNDPERLYSVNIPLHRLEGLEFDLENVRTIVEDDPDLIEVLMGDDLKAYESMVMAPHLYLKELQRFDESIRLVLVEDENESEEKAETSGTLDAVRLESTLREFVSAEIDYDIHKNLEADEETGDDSYPELTKKFINLYNKQ